MQFMEALYRVEMHSQAQEIRNNHLKTKFYKIGIYLPHIIYEFLKTELIDSAETEDYDTMFCQSMLSMLNLA